MTTPNLGRAVINPASAVDEQAGAYVSVRALSGHLTLSVCDPKHGDDQLAMLRLTVAEARALAGLLITYADAFEAYR